MTDLEALKKATLITINEMDEWKQIAMYEHANHCNGEHDCSEYLDDLKSRWGGSNF